MRVYQRAVISGTHLRLVLTNPIVQRVLSVNGLDRLIPIYPSLDAAVAAGTKRQETPDKPENAAITLAMPRIDYPAEIKRWRAFADQAEQMAKHWEQRP
jgi:hypothetical protein